MSNFFSTPIKTKLAAPKIIPQIVIRPRLLSLLDKGASRKLTLLSAPAGYGKTTLVAEWTSLSKHQTVWISIDKDDNDIFRFVEYFIAALQQVDPNFGNSALETMYSPHPSSMTHIATILINDMVNFPDDVVLVLDDYHMVHSQEIHDAVLFMINHLPNQFHLFITSRTDPPFSLSKFRARNQLTEVRIEDLKFNKTEIEQFFLDSMKIDLSTESVSTLHQQTEGWIAGLQMASLSLKQKSSSGNFLERIPRFDHHIFEYLEEEIFFYQPENIQNFLLKTAFLKRLNASLCDDLLERDDSREVLDYLDKANLFISLLDNEREWYRYHQLFADLLLFRLKKTMPGTLNELHLKASKWFERQGLIEDALYHTLEAEAYELSADLLEKMLEESINSEILKSYNELNLLPENIIQTRPVLLIYKSVLSQYLQHFGGISEDLVKAEILIQEMLSENPMNKGYESNRLNDLLGRTFALRAWQAYLDGHYNISMKLAKEANEYLMEESYAFKVTAMLTIAYTYLLNGELKESKKYFNYVIDFSQRKGFIFYESLGVHGLFSVKMICGEFKTGETILNQAMARYNELFPERNRQLSAYSTILLDLGSLYRNQHKLDLAVEYLTKGVEIAKNHSNPLMVVFGYVELAFVILAKGDEKAAYEMLINAKTVLPEHAVNMLKMPAHIEMINVFRNHLEPVKEWIEKKGMTIHDRISVFNEFEYITYASFLMAENNCQDAISLLNKLSESAKEGKRYGSLRHIQMLLALSHYRDNNTNEALETIHHALMLAEPDDHIQIFIDQRAPLSELLTLYRDKYREVSSAGLLQFTNKLIDLIKERNLSAPRQNEPLPTPPDSEKKLPWSYRLDPLSKRELEILRLIASNATNPEIADKLCISLNTVKTHLKRIYSKLYVNSRKKAVQQSKAIGLIE